MCPLCARYCHKDHSLQRYENGKECACSHKIPSRIRRNTNSNPADDYILERQMEYSNVWSLLPGPDPDQESLMRTLGRTRPRERSFLSQILHQRDSCFSVESQTKYIKATEN